jgi:hypothetical protein
VAVAVAVDVAVEVAVVVVVVVCSSVVAGWVLSTVVVGPLVRSLSARGSDAPAGGGPVRSSTKAESNVERVMAATIAPTSTTGASAAVRANSVRGESPAWVRLRTR